MRNPVDDRDTKFYQGISFFQNDLVLKQALRASHFPINFIIRISRANTHQMHAHREINY